MAKMGELKRAAQQLGVTSTTLRQQGWTTAPPVRVQAVKENPPGWLIAAGERRAKTVAAQQRRRDHRSTARRLRVRERAVREHDILPEGVDDLLASPPDWSVLGLSLDLIAATLPLRDQSSEIKRAKRQARQLGTRLRN